MSFNILDVLDNIDNIDLTQNYIYVLELEDNHYYIGRTSNFIQRMNEHFTNNGSLYTKKYKPIKIKEVVQEKSCYDERDKTIEYMEKYGWENVRGYTWCREIITKKPKIKTKNIMSTQVKEYFIDENDNMIKDMYTIQNKNIIEIGNYLNRTPGSVAYSLEKMGIVNRRQLSRGYFDYIFSDLYEKSKKDNKLKINKKDKIEEEYIFKDNPKPEKIKLSKDEIKNIKHRLHNMLNTYKEIP